MLPYPFNNLVPQMEHFLDPLDISDVSYGFDVLKACRKYLEKGRPVFRKGD